MKLEERVVSLELAKRLKELGVKQESLFYWREDKGFTDPYDSPFTTCELRISQHGASTKTILELPRPKDSQYTRTHSAFTSYELGEMLPVSVALYGRMDQYLESFKLSTQWSVIYRSGAAKPEFQFTENIEADARAKMLIHLIETGIIKP